jgi:hypothetical protein
MTELLSRGRPHHDVDGLLRSFFEKETPDPWPGVGVPECKDARKRPALLNYPRLVLAASIVLMLVGYLKLAEMLPPERAQGLAPDRSRMIGSRPGIKHERVPIRGGGEALLSEEVIPGGIIINVQELKRPRQR